MHHKMVFLYFVALNIRSHNLYIARNTKVNRKVFYWLHLPGKVSLSHLHVYFYIKKDQFKAFEFRL